MDNVTSAKLSENEIGISSVIGFPLKLGFYFSTDLALSIEMHRINSFF